MTSASIDLGLDRLARIAVEVGVALQPGQPLIVIAPLAARSFVHRLAKAAYRAAGGLVSCEYQDPDLIRLALTEMDLSVAAARSEPLAESGRRASNAGVLHLAGPEPRLLDGIPVERIIAAHKFIDFEAAGENAGDTNACIMPFVTKDWATAIRPDLPADEAITALWRDIFTLCGADVEDAAGDIAARLDRTAHVCGEMDGLPLVGLRLVGGGTDLHLRPLLGARWSFSQRTSSIGVRHLAELPLGPARIHLDPSATHGVLKIAHALKIAGATVRDLVLRFEQGRVVQCSAGSGQEAFEKLIATDEGAARLGMIGLVETIDGFVRPTEGFLAPVLDRACQPHVTFGSAIEAFGRSTDIAGANHSALSIDTFFDVGETEIHGRLQDGRTVPLQVNGKFLFA